MTSSLDMTICRRCGEPMAAVVSGGALPRYLCRLCGDLGFAAVLPSVGPAPAGDVTQFITGTIEQVGLNLDVSFAATRSSRAASLCITRRPADPINSHSTERNSCNATVREQSRVCSLPATG